MMNEMNMLEGSSPFAVYEGEKLVRVAPQSYCRFIKLNEIQQNIICAVNQCLVLNGYLLRRYLEKLGVELTPEECKYQLKVLSQNNYLQKMEFHIDETAQHCRAYCVGRKGKGWLAAMGKRIRMSGYLDCCCALQMKKLLCANQTIIELAEAEQLKTINPAQIIKNSRENQATKLLFRAYGFVKGDKNTYIVEPIRNEKDCIDNLKEKLKRMDAVLKNKIACSVSIDQIPTVILVAENKYLMEFLMEGLEKCRYKTVHLAFSYDKAVLEQDEKLFYPCKKSFWSRLLAG